jgi:hypothetical protein
VCLSRRARQALKAPHHTTASPSSSSSYELCPTEELLLKNYFHALSLSLSRSPRPLSGSSKPSGGKRAPSLSLAGKGGWMRGHIVVGPAKVTCWWPGMRSIPTPAAPPIAFRGRADVGVPWRGPPPHYMSGGEEVEKTCVTIFAHRCKLACADRFSGRARRGLVMVATRLRAVLINRGFSTVGTLHIEASFYTLALALQ